MTGLPYPDGEWPATPVPDGLDFEEFGDPLDELLARRVAERFVQDPEIRSGHVVIAVQNRVAILQGRLDSPQARDAAGRQAWATPGIFDVCNRLAVA